MTKQNETGIIRTKMAGAFILGLQKCNEEGRNPGRLGRHILTAKAKGVGVKYVPRPQGKKPTLHLTAVSAGRG